MPRRHLKDASWLVALKPPSREKARRVEWCSQHLQHGKRVEAVESFKEASTYLWLLSCFGALLL